MESKRFIYCFFLYFLAYFYASKCADTKKSERNFEVVFKKVKCNRSNSNYIAHFSCKLRRHSNSRMNFETINTNFTFAQFPMDMRVKVLVDLKPLLARQSIKLIDSEISACRFLDGGVPGSIFGIVYNAVMKFANLRMKCPLTKNFNYTITNLYLDVMDFPSYVPKGSFRVLLDFLTKSKAFAYHYVWADIIHKKNAKQITKSSSQKFVEKNKGN